MYRPRQRKHAEGAKNGKRGKMINPVGSANYGKIGKYGIPKMGKPAGSSGGELIGDITLHGVLKMVKMATVVNQ